MKIKLFIGIILVVVITIGSIIWYNFKPKKEIVEQPKEEEKVVGIDGYGIHLKESDTSLYQEEYEKLKENLLSDKIDEEAYASSIAKMFIIDLYTINNKVNKYDVGGVDFVLKEYRDNYILNVENTIYKYVLDNSKNDRVQELPIVDKIEIISTKKDKFKIKEEDTEYDAYKFKLKWEYVKDYGYDKTGEVIVIKKDNQMHVVEKN